MGPTILFDKSFLQSLSIDESVWFDHFFISCICPLFYVETLANLDKGSDSSSSAHALARKIADKFPEVNGAPNISSLSACEAELHGHYIPMRGQILLAGGRPVGVGSERGVVFDESPESQAFHRWQKRDFHETERLFARNWRLSLQSLDLSIVAPKIKELNVNGKNCQSLEQAHQMAKALINSFKNPFELMKLIFGVLNFPEPMFQVVMERWKILGFKPLLSYAPYTHHVLSVEIFFQIAVEADLISRDRASNKVDIAYLHYLPFTEIFISADKLHRKCSTLFMKSNQQFLWGQDMKQDLKELNRHFDRLPEEIKRKGLSNFASKPPQHINSLVTDLWDKYRAGWDESDASINVESAPKTNTNLVNHLNKFTKAPELSPNEIDFDISDPPSITLGRAIKKKKGSWFQIPYAFNINEDNPNK